MANAKIQTLIVDDEPLACEKLSRWLGEDAEIAVVKECYNGHEALERLASEPVDLLFLDMQMPELSGLDVLSRLRDSHPAALPLIVFVTAYDHYAIDAFKHHAIDYLLKPYDIDRFRLTLARAKSQLKLLRQSDWQTRLSEASQMLSAEYAKRLVVKVRDREILIKVHDINWLEADGNYTRIHTAQQQYLLTEALGKLESKLNPAEFSRIHRSAMVNLDRIKELHPASHGDYTVVLHDGTQLAMSRTYRSRFRKQQ